MENRVKERRLELGITQGQLADAVGVSQSSISEIESGKHMPTVEAAILIARALDSSVESIFIVV